MLTFIVCVVIPWTLGLIIDAVLAACCVAIPLLCWRLKVWS